jgi:hypothetical protein
MTKIYHITHVDNLASIIADGELYSDAKVAAANKANTNIGMTEIKRRRLARPVSCCPDTMVGDYVPFLFCSRSVMLYLIYRGNHPGLSYQGGQEPIAHLVADLESVVEWANEEGRDWAFSLGNAATTYVEFCNDLGDLPRLNWSAIQANNWQAAEIKEGKQAEFLVWGSFPWRLIERVGVFDNERAEKARAVIADAEHRPPVMVRRGWYY